MEQVKTSRKDCANTATVMLSLLRDMLIMLLFLNFLLLAVFELPLEVQLRVQLRVQGVLHLKT